MSDGGYYAIKGFAFQFDKTILELFNEPDENTSINIEQIQDISGENFVMQVKYKEQQDYSDNKIKEPVIQLIEEFQKDQTKEYILYCHFRDISPKVEVIGLPKLNNILSLSTGKSKESEKINRRINDLIPTLKNDFITKFKLIFAPTCDAQFVQVLTKLKALHFIGKNDDLAILFYSNIVDYLKRIIVNNTNPTERKCSRKQLLDYIKNGKRLIFDASFKEYKGDQTYFNFIKTKYIKARKNQKNLVILGNTAIDSSVSLSKLIIDIVERHYKNATYDLEPLIFILPDRLILEVKNNLIEHDININDGYESILFKEKLFFQDPIKTKKKIGARLSDSLDKISFKFRILSRTKFEHITNHMRYQMIYYFDSELIKELISSSFLKIDDLNTKQIHDIFNF